MKILIIQRIFQKKKNNDKKGKNEKGKGLMEIFLESLEEGIY